VDERIWTELYMCNRECVLSELDGLIQHLSVYRDALEKGDSMLLSNTLKEGKIIRKNIKLRKD
jgi:prephenate dehydrogenase